MALLITIGVMIVGIVVLTPLAERVAVPQPVLLTVFGLLVPLVPGTPALSIDPEIILPVVLPPLLFAASQRTTFLEVRESARPILLLAVGLTLFTAGVVAVVAHLAGLGWGAAWVLGAVVSPPDPVAATAVARRLRLPNRLVAVLEGEGLFNDATALVLFQVAVVAAVSGAVTAGTVAGDFALAIGLGTLVGVVMGWVTKQALARLHLGPPETLVTAAAPFVTYLLAEEVHGSGVLAVLGLGLFLRSFGHSALTSTGYLLGRSVWGFADFTITSFVFVLIGFELTELLTTFDLDASSLGLAAAVAGTVVVARAVWIFPAAWLARYGQRRREAETPYGWQETAVAAWAGMRGVVTVATALAIPVVTDAGNAFPSRDELVFVALSTVLVTLIVQGLTLSPLVSALGVGTESDVPREVAELRRQAASKVVDVLHEELEDHSEPVRDVVRARYESFLAAQDVLQQARRRGPEEGGLPVDELRAALQVAASIERDVVLEARRRGTVSPAAADQVLDDVETRAARGLD